MPKLSPLCLILLSTSAIADEVPRTSSVSGEGSVETPPDRATLVFSIVARDSSVGRAQAEAAEVTAKVLALTEELEIPDSQVDSMSASVRPDYRWNRETQEQELLGFIAERQMRVELHDLEKVGVVIERAVEVGVNQVSPPQLTSSKRRDAYRDALAAAAEDARANAERLAATLGLTLGSAIQVNTGPVIRPPMPVARVAEMSAAVAAPETYNAGDMTVSASVSVVFEVSP